MTQDLRIYLLIALYQDIGISMFAVDVIFV